MPNTKLCALVVSKMKKKIKSFRYYKYNSCISKEGLLNYSGMELILCFWNK